MPPKSLKLDSLELDLENPRITHAGSQREAMQKIISEQRAKLVNLAESISVRGFSPIDRCLVLRSSRTAKFIVLEGNRRVLCAKLLKNPSLIHTFTMPNAFRKRLEKAAKKFDPKTVEPVDCFEVSDRAEGNDWIRQRHSGEDAGRGIAEWSAVAKARFAGRTPALQALEFVAQHGELSEDQADRVNNSRFLTTLDRLLSNPAVRAAIGFNVDKGRLLTELPAQEAIKPLKKIVLDLAEKEINVNDVKTKEQQNAYVSELKPSERPDLSRKTGKEIAVDSFKEQDFSAEHAPASRRSKTARSRPRTTVVPRTCKLNIPIAKIEGIYSELQHLQLKHVHAIGVLMRVFLEMSIDDYLENKAGSKLTFTDPNSGRHIDKKLRDKVKETIDHMVANGTPERELKGVWVAVNDKLNPFSIDTLHAYIHNRFFTPTDSHLTTGWDNAQRFFEKIWP
ncbi:MAG: hypothetical protein WB622_03490 [Acidobacteriaceae bacterium]